MVVRRYTNFVDPEGELRPMVPRIGKIGLGIKVKSKGGRGIPREVDYFVLDDPSVHVIADTWCKDGVIIPHTGKVHKIDQATCDAWKAGTAGPKALPIMFTSDQIEEVAPKVLEWWYGGGDGKPGSKRCFGNGVEAQRLVWGPNNVEDPAAARQQNLEPHYIEWKCPCDDFFEAGNCKRCIRLSFMMPDISIRGTFQIDSASRATISRLEGDMGYLFSIFGRLSGLIDPDQGSTLLVLRRVPWTSTSGDKRTHYAVTVQAIDIKGQRLMGLRRALVAENAQLKQLSGQTTPMRELPAGKPETGPEQPRSHGNDEYLGGGTAPPLDVTPTAQEPTQPEPERLEPSDPFDPGNAEDPFGGQPGPHPTSEDTTSQPNAARPSDDELFGASPGPSEPSGGGDPPVEW